MASLFFFLLLSLAISGSSVASKEGNAHKFLIATCNRTPEPKTCISYISALPESKKISNIHDLTLLSYRAIENMKNKTSFEVDDLRENFTPFDENCLFYCYMTFQKWDDNASKLAFWKKAVEKKWYRKLDPLVQSVLNDIKGTLGQCIDEKGQQIYPDQIHGSFGDLAKLYKVLLALAKMDASK